MAQVSTIAANDIADVAHDGRKWRAPERGQGFVDPDGRDATVIVVARDDG